MAGLLDLIAAPSPERARNRLSDLLAGPQERLSGLLTDPAMFLNNALREAIGSDDLERRWAWNQNKLDAVSGSAATRASVDDAANRAALNLGLLGSLAPGKYPQHMWRMKGQELEKAAKEMEAVYPKGIPDKHQEGVRELIDALKERGLLPVTDVDKGGSVYVSAVRPVLNKSGEVSKKKFPEAFGRQYTSYFGGSAVDPFLVRFSDHGQLYHGPNMSIDPLSGNTIDTAKQYLAYILGQAEKPTIGTSTIIPALGEQYGTLKPR